MTGPLLMPPGLLLKRLLLLFWAMLFSMAALTNLVDFLGEIGVMDWTFLNSSNYEYLRSVVDVYDVGPGLTKAMLFGALVIEAVAAWLFARALLESGQGGAGLRAALNAVCWGIAVWTAFIFAVEVFVAYESGSVFRELFAIMVVTGLALVLVPDAAGEEQRDLPGAVSGSGET